MAIFGFSPEDLRLDRRDGDDDTAVSDSEIKEDSADGLGDRASDYDRQPSSPADILG
jgi:hypothetical protein